MRTPIVPKNGSFQDVKRHLITSLSIALSIGLFFGCSNVDFGKNAGTNAVGPTATTICTPIGGPVPSKDNGLYGDIYVQDPNSCNGPNHSPCNSIPQMTSAGTKVSDIVIAAPLVTSRPFTAGFNMKDGSLLKYPASMGSLAGQAVKEYFGMKLRTKVALAAGDSAGDYEFAMLVDDGVKITREDTGQVLLNSDNLGGAGITPTQLMISHLTLHLDPGQKIPLEIDYYQSPAVSIAFYMLWRNTSVGDNAYEGNLGDSFWFDQNTFNTSVPNQSLPTANFNDLINNHGWRSMRALNFWMPDGYQNQCI